MAVVNKPLNINDVWAESGDVFVPTQARVLGGWGIEIPPRQLFNYIDNKQDQAIAHINQHGVALWDAVTEYQGNLSLTLGSNGILYQALVTNSGNDPVADVTNTFWKVATSRDSDTYALDTGTANAYIATYVPAISEIVDGMLLRFKALNNNTGNSTFTPNGLASKPIVGLAHTQLLGGEIVATGNVLLQYNASLLGSGAWVLLANSGGSLQITPAVQDDHAITLSQFNTGISEQLNQLSTSYIIYYMGQI